MKWILFIDDEQFILGGLKRLFRDYRDRWHMLFALNGKEALEYIRNQKIDLIITDIRMPGMSGLELLSLLKSDEKTKYIPVIVVTGFQDSALKHQALELGAEDLLNKPVNKADLVARIKNALERSHIGSELYRYRNLVATQEEMIKSLERTNKHLSEKKYSKSENRELTNIKNILGSIAHSLKGEFLNIGDASEQIRESSTALAVIEDCEMIERSVVYSELLLRQLLDYIEVGKLRNEPINMWELLTKAHALFEPRLPSNIDFNVNRELFTISPDLIRGDYEQLMSILMELINNAKNALLVKGGKILIDLGERDDKIEILVSDDGEGIPPKIRKKILKQQVPSKNGLGLGLFLAAKVVKEMGGDLTLKRSTKKGTTFSLVLPKIDDTDDTDDTKEM